MGIPPKTLKKDTIKGIIIQKQMTRQKSQIDHTHKFSIQI